MKKRFLSLLLCLLLLAGLLPIAAFAATMIDSVEAESYFVPFVGSDIPVDYYPGVMPDIFTEHVKLMYYNWKDLTTGYYAVNGEQFQEGHSYRLIIQAWPENALYRFAANPTVTINGFPAVITSWSEDCLIFYYDFPMYFSEFEVTNVPEPREPDYPCYTFTLEEPLKYAFDDSQDETVLYPITKNGVTWSRYNESGGYYSDISSHIAFAPFQAYRLTVRLKAQAGFAFDRYTHGTIGGRMALVTQVAADGSWLEARVDFDPFGEWLDTLAYTVRAPEAGAHPVFIAESEDQEKYGLSAAALANYELGVAWYDETDGLWLSELSTFVQDHEYTVYLHAAPGYNYRFAVDGSGDSAVSATVNGQAASVAPDSGNRPKELLILSTTFAPCPCARLRQVSVSIDTPRPEVPASHAPRLDPEAPYQLVTDDPDYPGGVRWMTYYTSEPLAPGECPEQGRIYQLFLKLEPKDPDQYLFSPNALEISVTINGLVSDVQHILNDGRYLVVTRAFTVDYNYVDSVGVGLTRPAALGAASFSAFSGDARYTVEDYNEENFHHGVCWTDETARVDLEPGDRFIGGHSYTACVAVVPTAGARFNVPLSGARIATEDAELVGENTPERAVIRKTWILPVTQIDAVELSVAPPMEDSTASFLISHAGNAPYVVREAVWTDATTGDALDEQDVCVAGRTYTLTVTLEARDGCSFVCDAEGDPTFAARINGKSANLYKVFGQDAHQTVRVACTFTVQTEMLDAVDLLLTLPMAGEYGWTWAPGTEQVELGDVCWIDDAAGLRLGGETPLEPDKTYILTFALYAKSGCAFSCDEGGEPNAAVTVNGLSAYVERYGLLDPHKALFVSFTFTAQANLIEEVSVSIPPPLPGELPDLEPEAEPEVYAVGAVWTDLTTGETLGPGDAFVEGHAYRAAVTLRPEQGYLFRALHVEETWVPDVDADFNGKSLTEGELLPGPAGDARLELVLQTTFSCAARQRYFLANFSGYGVGNSPDDVTVQVEDGADYEIEKWDWTDQLTGALMTGSDPFAEGRTYTLDVHLRRTGGAPFEADYDALMDRWTPSYYAQGEINGQSCGIFSSEDRDGRDYLLLRFYAEPCGKIPIDRIALSGFAPIELGQTLQEYRDSLSLTVPVGAPYSLVQVSCGDMLTDDVFSDPADTVLITAEVRAAEGFCFRTVFDPMNLSYLLLWGTEAEVNGEPAYISYQEVPDARYTVFVSAQVPQLATVSFAPNVGTGEMEAVKLRVADSLTLPACSFTPPANKAFRCWNVDGMEYAPGDSVRIWSNTVVRAIWRTDPLELTALTRAGSTFWFALSREAPAGAKLVLAAYEPVSGQLLAAAVCENLTAESIVLNAPESAKVVGYLLDKDNRPLCQWKTAA